MHSLAIDIEPLYVYFYRLVKSPTDDAMQRWTTIYASHVNGTFCLIYYVGIFMHFIIRGCIIKYLYIMRLEFTEWWQPRRHTCNINSLGLALY